MSEPNNKNFIDLGSDPIGDDFDPFASDDELDAGMATETSMQESKSNAPAQKESKSKTTATADNPLETAISAAETKEAEKAQQGIMEKQPMFEYAGATEDTSSIR